MKFGWVISESPHILKLLENSRLHGFIVPIMYDIERKIVRLFVGPLFSDIIRNTDKDRM